MHSEPGKELEPRRRSKDYSCMKVSALAPLLALAIGIPAIARGQQSPVVIRGLVTDTASRPIELAQVSTERSSLTITDAMGRFELRVNGGTPGAIRVRRIGYQSREISLTAADTSLTVVLVPISARLEAMRAEVERTVRSLELRGFYDRLRERTIGANTGYFLTPEDVEQRNVTRPSVLVDGLPGVKILTVQQAGSVFGYRALFGSSRCPMTIYLDGTRLSELRGTRPVDIDLIINAREIAAVEVYTRSNAPDEYRSLNGNCGVALFWSK